MHKQEYCCFGLLWTSRTLIPYHSLITFLCASIKSGQESQTASGAWLGGWGLGGESEENQENWENIAEKQTERNISWFLLHLFFFKQLD